MFVELSQGEYLVKAYAIFNFFGNRIKRIHFYELIRKFWRILILIFGTNLYEMMNLAN